MRTLPRLFAIVLGVLAWTVAWGSPVRARVSMWLRAYPGVALFIVSAIALAAAVDWRNSATWCVRCGSLMHARRGVTLCKACTPR